MTVKNHPRPILALTLFLLFFSLYITTAAFDVSGADSGELISASYVLGIPHATGYSAYCQLNRIAAMSIPFGNIAFRSSLVSVFFGSLAVLLFFLYVSSRFPVLPSFFDACQSLQIYRLYPVTTR